MPIDIEKLKNMSASVEAEHRKRIEQEDDLARQRQLAQPAISAQWADEAIKMIPQIVEEAARKGLRQAEVFSYCGDSFTAWPNIFIGGYFLFGFPEHFRQIYYYCKSNKLKPKIVGNYVYENIDAGIGSTYYKIQVYW